MPKPSTKKQRMMIATMGRRYFVDDDQYRQFLDDNYGVESSTELTLEEARDCIDVLKCLMDGRPVPERRGRGIWISDDQRDKIMALFDLCGYTSAPGIYKFLNRQTGKNKGIHMLTRYEATKVILGLQRIYAGKDKALFDQVNRSSANDLRFLPRKVGV